MLSLAEEFRASGSAPERSLLLAFEANLPLLERRLVPDLQRTGAGEVTLLVDHAAYRESFADASALTRVGVDYAVHPVRLPGPAAACHAKLYLLLRADAACLLVASANLTTTGLARNLEVVDRLELGANGMGDRAAFTRYLEMLEALPGLAPGLGAARQALGRAVAELRVLLSRGDGETVAGIPPGGPHLLHTAVAPLLGQVRALIPADEVREIVAISPFFDGESRAILALAAAYPGATLRVLKDAMARGDLNGQAMAPLGDRVQVEVIEKAEGVARRLHAKAVMFLGARRAWVLAGSANLTAPAWLSSAAGGGNLEAVTLREAAAGRSDVAAARAGITRLLEALTTRVIPHATLVPEEVERLEAGPPALEILSAVARPAAVTLCCTAGPWSAADARLTLTLASRDEAVAIGAALTERTSDAVRVRAILTEPAAETLAFNNAAVLVTLESRRPDGTRVIGRAWLEKPDFLRLGATDRARRHALALMTERILVSDTHLYHVAEWLLGTTAAMEADLRAIGEVGTTAGGLAGGPAPGRNGAGATGATGRGPNTGGAEPGSTGDDAAGAPAPWDASWEEDDPDEGEIVIDPAFLADDSDPDGGHGGSGTAQASPGRLRRLDTYLRSTTRLVDRLFRSEDGAPSHPATTGISLRGPGLDRDDDEWGVEGEEAWPVASGDADRLLRESAENGGRAVAHAIRVAPTPAAVARVCDTLDVLGAYLFRLELQARHWESGAVAACAQARQRAAARGGSVGGWERGLCRAWMPRAMVHPGAAEALSLAWRDSDRVARHLALQAAGAALSGDPVPAGIIAGIEAVTGERADPDGALGPRLRLHAETLAAHSSGRLTTDLVLAALTSTIPAVADAGADAGAIALTGGAAVIMPWLPLVPVLEARTRGASEGTITRILAEASLKGAALSVARKLLRARQVAGLRQSNGRPTCSACHVGFSTHRVQDAGRPGLRVLSCENCGALLVPVAWHDPLVRRLLATLAPTSDRRPTGSSALGATTPTPMAS